MLVILPLEASFYSGNGQYPVNEAQGPQQVFFYVPVKVLILSPSHGD